nr:MULTISPECIES: hypothetical protein [Clostridia]
MRIRRQIIIPAIIGIAPLKMVCTGISVATPLITKILIPSGGVNEPI